MAKSARNKAVVASVKAKALIDPDFRQRLKENPTQILKEEGAVLPEGTQIKVIENDANTRHLVIPHVEEGQINEAALSRIAGAGTETTCTYTTELQDLETFTTEAFQVETSEVEALESSTTAVCEVEIVAT